MTSWATKDWDKIVRELSSDEDSDAGDTLNVMSVQRNAKRVADLIRMVSPEAEAAARYHGGAGTPAVTPPMGANRASVVQHMLRGEVPAAAVAAAQAAKGKEKKAEGDSA